MTRWPGQNKYGNKTQKCWKDHSHDSVGEAQYCNKLNLLERAKEIRSYRTQVSFPLKVKRKTVCSHIVDFLVIEQNGQKTVHEFKGFDTALWKLKMKLFQAVYPKIPYLVKREGDLL